MKKPTLSSCVTLGELFNLKLALKTLGNIRIDTFYGFYEGLN